MGTTLDNLAALSTIVADTGEIEQIRRFRPNDCTTNPSLLLKAAQLETYQPLVRDAIAWGKGRTASHAGDIAAITDRLAVAFGTELLAIVPGYVSTEVDAALSFDTQGSVDKARRLLAMYEELGAPRERVLIKLAATWEGVQAARILQAEGINCNMTLIFSPVQALACAQAGAFLVSPFVGRITDWYKAAEGRDYAPPEDPGVLSVESIYNTFKARGHGTIVMAASFRTTGQILQLAGCDRLTISPALLEELAGSDAAVERMLEPADGPTPDRSGGEVDENGFRWELNQDAMATEKLAEGIRRFHQDAERLHETIDAMA